MTGQDQAPTTAHGEEMVGGRLRHLVEQLWRAPHGEGHLRLVLDGDVDPGWVEVERYLVVPTVARATMLLPARPPAALTGSLLNYRGLRRRLPNAQRAVLGAATRAHVPLPFPRLSLQVPRDLPPGRRAALPLEVLGADLGCRLYASVGVRTGANRKATLQLVDAEGVPRGFAKIAWDDPSRAGVLREEEALADARRSASPITALTGPAGTPALLARGQLNGWPYIVTEPLPTSCRGVRADVPPPSPQELFSLCPPWRTAPLADSAQLRALRERLDALPVSAGTRQVVDAARATLQVLMAHTDPLPLTVRWHGDLTPWNAARDAAGALWCWDWESSEADAVAGLDALHWQVTVGTEGGRRLTGPLLRDALQRSDPVLVAAGVPRTARALVAAAYAVTIAERACALAEGGGGWERDWVLPAELVDLLDAAGQLVRAGG